MFRSNVSCGRNGRCSRAVSATTLDATMSSANAIEKQDVLQAVVVASFFHKRFWPAAGPDDACLMPLVNRPLLHYSLDLLETAGIVDVVVFCSSGSADRIRAFVRSGFPRLNVVCTASDTCRSFGDVIRHLDACALIRNDFVLLWGNVVGRLALLPLVKRFKSLRKRDRGAVMTLIYQRAVSDDINNDGTLVLDSDTGRVLHHARQGGRVDLPLDLALEHTVQVRRDLCETNVAICSTAVPCLFADNFDFQTKDDFVKGLLINEEILNSTLYAHVVDDGRYVGEVVDWPSYQRVSHDVLHRWTYPQVPDVAGRYSLRYGNVYLGDNLKLALTSDVGNDTAVGPSSTLAAGARVSGSVVGENCVIGANVTIINSYLFDGVRIGDNCVVRYSVVGRDCTLGNSCSVTHSCILGADVVLGHGTELRGQRVHCINVTNKMVKLGDQAYLYDTDEESDSDDEQDWPNLSTGSKMPCVHDYPSSTESDDDAVSIAASIPDDMCMFYSEVVDSLIRGFEDHVHCDNLILEINSSRYAYNINYREANFQVIRAMLTLSTKAQLEALNQVRYFAKLQSQLDYFLPVLKNYIKTMDSCEDCLSAIEDVAKGEEMLNAVVVKVIHHLYNENVLSEESILKWHQKEEDSQFAKNIREKAIKLVQWLKEAEEETDSEEEDSL